MAPLLHSKHQKLILQCYPSGRDIDKKPNSSELSYLLYYASTRRVKLEKVGNFIEKKTITDLKHYSRYGNVQVSLLIVKNLIEKCSENLNVFADNVISIFRHTLLSKDLILIQVALKVFKVFCNKLDKNLFIGNGSLVTEFSALCKEFLGLASNAGEKAVENQWKIISIKAAKYLSSVSGFNVDKSSKESQIVNRSLNLILSVLYSHFSVDDLKETLSTVEFKMVKRNELSAQNTRGSRVLSRTKTNIFDGYEIDDSTEENVNINVEWSDLEIAQDALVALKAYFSPNAINILHNSLRAYNHFMYNKVVEEDPSFLKWNSVLGQIIIYLIPVQLRFLVLTFCIRSISSVQDEPVKDTDAQYQLVLSHLVSELLNSRVNMIGLSVLDILKELLSLQLRSVSNKELVGLYTTCISGLAKHIYYQDQISDIIEEISFILNDCLLKASNMEKQALTLMNDIIAILSGKARTALDNEDVLKAYGGSNELDDDGNSPDIAPLIKDRIQFFLDAWLNFAGYINDANSATLFSRYYVVLCKFLVIELGVFDEIYDGANDGLGRLPTLISKGNLSFSQSGMKSEWPNYSNLILDSLLNGDSKKSNNLIQLLKGFDIVLTNYSENLELISSLNAVQYLIVQVFGINFIFNGIDPFFLWQSQKDTTLKICFGYNFLVYASEYLYYKYNAGDKMFGNTSDPNPFADLVSEVWTKLNAQSNWDTRIPSPVSRINIQKASKTSETQFTKPGLLSLFEPCDLTNKWIVLVSNGVNPFANGSANRSSSYEPNAENASILSASKLAANLTAANTTAANTTAISGQMPSFIDLKHSVSANLLKPNDLKNMVSKTSLLDKEIDRSTENEADVEAVTSQLKNMIENLSFDDSKYLSTRVLMNA